MACPSSISTARFLTSQEKSALDAAVHFHPSTSVEAPLLPPHHQSKRTPRIVTYLGNRRLHVFTLAVLLTHFATDGMYYFLPTILKEFMGMAEE